MFMLARDLFFSSISGLQSVDSMPLRRFLCVLFLLLAFALPSYAQTLSLDGYWDLQPNGNDTTYMRSLTSRHVNGQLRLLTLTHTGVLQEFAIGSTPMGGKISAVTGAWNISSVSSDFTGIWYEEAKNRLWVTSTVDYGDAGTYYPTRISTLTLGANGAVSNVKTVSLQGVDSKRIYGGVQPLPSAAQAALGCGPYLVGWGGYTSLMAQTSRASLGPSIICIPDISSYANGAQIPSSAFKVLLDTDTDHRGVRKTIPTNYFDGGDPRQNPSTPPTSAPLSSAQWLSPSSDGLGWMVWGDSYYNNCVTTSDALICIAALAKGRAWYATSTLNFDARTQEVHVFPLAALRNGLLTRPASMSELVLPRGYTAAGLQGDTPTGNVSGLTLDAATGKAYAVIYPAGPDVFTGRLYQFTVSGAGSTPAPPPTPTPTDATVSDWSAWSPTSDWSACTSGSQTRTEQRTRSVVTPAIQGGATPALVDTRTVSQACTASPPSPQSPSPLAQLLRWLVGLFR
jgi:hypothetical protein